ncbi:MAG: DsbA family protein [Pseudomonadota bacterium]
MRLDIFWSFRSPYAYLAVDRLVNIATDYTVDARLRVVRPLALREPDFFKKARPQFLPYMLHDLAREGERLGVKISLPQPDPVDMDLTTGVVAREQPHIDRLMSLGVAAQRAGKGLAAAQAISRRIWSGEPDWHLGDALKDALNAAGCEFEALHQWSETHTEDVKAEIKENEADQMKHHWGVPLMVLGEESFFGQDRIDTLLWRLNEAGLKRNEP